eukprot:CFRG0900T1
MAKTKVKAAKTKSLWKKQSLWRTVQNTECRASWFENPQTLLKHTVVSANTLHSIRILQQSQTSEPPTQPQTQTQTQSQTQPHTQTQPQPQQQAQKLTQPQTQTHAHAQTQLAQSRTQPEQVTICYEQPKRSENNAKALSDSEGEAELAWSDSDDEADNKDTIGEFDECEQTVDVYGKRKKQTNIDLQGERGHELTKGRDAVSIDSNDAGQNYTGCDYDLIAKGGSKQARLIQGNTNGKYVKAREQALSIGVRVIGGDEAEDSNTTLFSHSSEFDEDKQNPNLPVHPSKLINTHSTRSRTKSAETSTPSVPSQNVHHTGNRTINAWQTTTKSTHSPVNSQAGTPSKHGMSLRIHQLHARVPKDSETEEQGKKLPVSTVLINVDVDKHAHNIEVTPSKIKRPRKASPELTSEESSPAPSRQLSVVDNTQTPLSQANARTHAHAHTYGQASTGGSSAGTEFPTDVVAAENDTMVANTTEKEKTDVSCGAPTLAPEEVAARVKQKNQEEAARRIAEERIKRQSVDSTRQSFLQRQRLAPSVHSQVVKPVVLDQKDSQPSANSIDMRDIQKQRLAVAALLGQQLHFSGKTSSLSLADVKRLRELQELYAFKQSMGGSLASDQLHELNELITMVEVEQADFRKHEARWMEDNRLLYYYVPPVVATWAAQHIMRKRMQLVANYKCYYKPHSCVNIGNSIAVQASIQPNMQTQSQMLDQNHKYIQPQFQARTHSLENAHVHTTASLHGPESTSAIATSESDGEHSSSSIIYPEFTPVMVDDDPMVYKAGHVLHLQPGPGHALPYDSTHNPFSSLSDPGSGTNEKYNSGLHACNQSLPLQKIVHPIANPKRSRKWVKKILPPLSKDTRGLRLAEMYNADVLTTASALEYLASTMPNAHTGEREIPVICTTGQSEQKKIVILDKPLPMKRYSPKAINTFVFKNVVRGMASHPEHVTMAFSSAPLPAPPASTQLADTSKPASTQSADTSKPTSTTCSRNVSHENVHTNILRRHHIERIGGEDVDLSDDNLVYALWSLGSIRLLVRLSLHGYIQDSHNSARVVAISAKPEYVPTAGDSIGPEEDTQEELARWWVRTLLRPNALHLLARIDMIHNTVRYEMHDIVSQAAVVHSPLGIIAGRTTLRMYEVLHHLTGLSTGNYLVSQDSGQPSVSVLVESGISSATDIAYDLHAAHTDPITTDPALSIPALHSAFVPFFHIPGGAPWLPHLFPPPPDISIDEALDRMPRGKYCYAFARNGVCGQQKQCSYIHLSGEEVIRLASRSGNVPKHVAAKISADKRKRQKPHKFGKVNASKNRCKRTLGTEQEQKHGDSAVHPPGKRFKYKPSQRRGADDLGHNSSFDALLQMGAQNRSHVPRDAP